MRQLAYIASEMCYFASVDVRHLMRFCLHDKEGFWKRKLSMAALERLPISVELNLCGLFLGWDA